MTLRTERSSISTSRFGAVTRDARKATGSATAQPIADATTAILNVSSIGSIVRGRNAQLGFRSSAMMSAPRVASARMRPDVEADAELLADREQRDDDERDDARRNDERASAGRVGRGALAVALTRRGSAAARP